MPERATPKTTSGGRWGRTGSDGGGAHQTLARSLLSSRPVLLLAVLQFLLLSIVLPQIQFVVCDSRRDFTGPPCAYKKNQVPFAAKLAHILCFLCPSIAVVVVGRGSCFDFVAIVVVGGFLRSFYVHTHIPS